MLDAETERWLETLPLGEALDIGGEKVYLRIEDGGAELGAILIRNCTDLQLQDALRLGMRCAAEFDAGYSMSEDEATLCVTQWLPGAAGWKEAAEPLEKLLNQIDMLRAELEPHDDMPAPDRLAARIEQRLRTLYGEKTK